MSQPPPWDQGRKSSPDHTPDQDQPPSWPSGSRPSWPSGNQPPSWPSPGQQLPSWPPADQPPAWPSSGPDQGQPSSWPPGGFDQGQPPPWPPGGQPPDASPGYAYGYGPRPPRFRRRHPFRGALIALGLFIAFGFVVGHVTTSHSTVSATSAGPSASGGLATGRQAPPAAIGSRFALQDGNGNTYQVTLVKVIDPARSAGQLASPDSGRRFVGAVFKIKALKGSPQNEDANDDAVLVGGNGQTYSADFSAIAGYANFDNGTIRVAEGDTVTGAVRFRVPDGVAVSEVQWSALSGFGAMVEWDVRS